MSENQTKYSSQKLKKFKDIIEKTLSTTQEALTTSKKSLADQKKHIVQTNVDFNGNSKHFERQATNKLLIRRLQRKSRALKAALNRIEEGTYGICERTGELISEERLMVLPTARFNI